MSAFPHSYLVDSATALARVVANGAAKRLERYSPEDVERAIDAVLGLSGGCACDYRLNAIGPMYSLLFHGRRVHDALCHLHAAFKTLQPTPTSGILDYGTGTGAVVWCVALLHSQRCSPFPPGPLVLDAYDPSANMLEEAQALWRDLAQTAAFRSLLGTVAVRWRGGAGVSTGPITAVSRPARFIAAGYVLSDRIAVRSEVRGLLSYAERCRGNSMALWSSPSKLDEQTQRSDVLEVAMRRGWTERSVRGDDRLDRAGFWWKACDENPGGMAIQRVVAKWPDSPTKARVEARVQEHFRKFAWICRRPEHPLMCLAR